MYLCPPLWKRFRHPCVWGNIWQNDTILYRAHQTCLLSFKAVLWLDLKHKATLRCRSTEERCSASFFSFWLYVWLSLIPVCSSMFESMFCYFHCVARGVGIPHSSVLLLYTKYSASFREKSVFKQNIAVDIRDAAKRSQYRTFLQDIFCGLDRTPLTYVARPIFTMFSLKQWFTTWSRWSIWNF